MAAGGRGSHGLSGSSVCLLTRDAGLVQAFRSSTQGSRQGCMHRKGRQVGQQAGLPMQEVKPSSRVLLPTPLPSFLVVLAGWGWCCSLASNSSRSVMRKPLAYKLGPSTHTAYLLGIILPLAQHPPPTPPCCLAVPATTAAAAWGFILLPWPAGSNQLWAWPGGKALLLSPQD